MPIKVGLSSKILARMFCIVNRCCARFIASLYFCAMKLTILPEQFEQTPTPQQKKSQWGQQLVGTIIMIASMVVLLPLVLRAPRPNFFVPSTAVLILSAFLLFPIALFFSIVWHELGHLLAVKAARFRFVFVTFGPLRLAREARGLRLSLIHTDLMQWQGRALSVPRQFGEHLPQRMLFLAGGPLATLSQLLLLLWLNYLLRDETIPFGLGLALLWLLLSAVMLLPATAVADFSRVIELHPKTFPTIYIFRAAAYTQLGDYPAAIADYQTLLNLNPEEELRLLALESIHILQTAE